MVIFSLVTVLYIYCTLVKCLVLKPSRCARGVMLLDCWGGCRGGRGGSASNRRLEGGLLKVIRADSQTRCPGFSPQVLSMRGSRSSSKWKAVFLKNVLLWTKMNHTWERGKGWAWNKYLNVRPGLWTKVLGQCFNFCPSEFQCSARVF